MKLEKGTSFGNYILIDKKGDGSTAEVWECRNPEGISKAIKIFAPYSLLDDYSKELIKEEFEKTRNLIHPNLIVPEVYFEHNNIPALVMPLLERSMWQEFNRRQRSDSEKTEKLKSGIFSERYIVLLIKNISEALRFLHQNSLIHNDIKPANILVSKADNDNEVEFYLTDFGITREIRDTIIRQTSRHNSLTFAYAAPEKLRGHSSSIASDIFSLGASVYELVFGVDIKVPVGQILNNNGVLNFSSGHYSEQFLSLLERTMEKEPNKRISIPEIIKITGDYIKIGTWLPNEPTNENANTETYKNQNTEFYSPNKTPDEFNIPLKKYKNEKKENHNSPYKNTWLIILLVTFILIASGIIYWFESASFGSFSDEYKIKVNEEMYLIEKDGKVGIMDHEKQFIKPLEYESGEITPDGIKLYKNGEAELIEIK